MEQKMFSRQDTVAVVVGFSLVIAVSAFFLLKGTTQDTAKGITPTAEAPTQKPLPTIETDDLRNRLIADPSGMKVVDFRPATIFDSAHAAGSERLDTPGSLAGITLPKDGTIIVISSGNTDTDQAVSDTLTKSGKKFLFVKGGLVGWQEAGGFIVAEPNLSSPIDRSKVSLITVDDWKKLFATKNIVYKVLDIRPVADSAKAPVPGALAIPYAELEGRQAEIPVATNIALCAGTGDNAFRGAVRLFDLGSFSVKALDGNCADIIGK